MIQIGVMDSGIHVGRETGGYGTPAAPTRSYEGYGDGHKRVVEPLESAGLRAGMHTIRSDRRRIIHMGGEGELEVDVLDKGMGLLLQLVFGAPVITTPATGTLARLHTYTSNAAGPTGESLTVVMDRAPVSGANIPFRYHGGKATEFKLTQENDGYLKLGMTFDYEDETQDGGAPTPAYTAAAMPYAWPDCVVTIGGVATDVRKFEFAHESNLNVERRMLRGSVLKKEPIRVAAANYEGELEAEFTDVTEYNRFVAGAIVPIVATWTGTVIELALPYFFRVTLAACQYSGETPQIELGEIPVQPLPFKVLWDGVLPAVTIEYQTVDLAA